MRLPLWAARGALTQKNELSVRVSIDARTLPYRTDVLQFLHDQRNRGAQIVLTTASPQAWASAVGAELGVFHDILATDERVNLKGAAKLAAIQKWCRDRGITRWAYLGNDQPDLVIWQAATAAYVVDQHPSVTRELRRIKAPRHVFPARHSYWLAALKSIRPIQWVKNALIFVPIVTAHKIADPHLLLLSLLAFMAFSATASLVYVLNDLLDLGPDRKHPRKRHRPFASGALPVSFAPLISLVLLAVAAVTAAQLPTEFQISLLVYALASTSYAFWLKTKPLVDVILLAALYCLRVIAGGAAAGIPISEWLIAFSLFIFTSLALAKRYAELSYAATESKTKSDGRGYYVTDIGLLEHLGTTCGLLSTMVLAMYIQSPAIQALYRTPRLLWLLCPLMMYWTSRLWLIARRAKLHDDPLLFALRDRVSLTVLGVLLTIVAIAT